MAKKVQNEKKKVRNIAASRIQALWKGFWTRCHVLTKFSYGQAIYLNAVRKGLKNSYFILKMYKPCGLVCPKSEHARPISNTIEEHIEPLIEEEEK